MFRAFKSTNERRQIRIAKDWQKEYDFKLVRSRRDKCMLPDSWDDKNRCIERNWKSQRKRQYK